MSWFLRTFFNKQINFSTFFTAGFCSDARRRRAAAERHLQQNSASKTLRATAFRRLFAAPFVAAFLLLTFAGQASAQPLTWIYPAGGEQFVAGTSVPISWLGGDPNVDVTIRLGDVGLWQIVLGGISGAISNNGSVVWNINPNQLPNPNDVPRDYQLIIEEVGAANYRYSGTFEIIPPPRLDFVPGICSGSDATLTIPLDTGTGGLGNVDPIWRLVLPPPNGPYLFQTAPYPASISVGSPLDLIAIGNDSWYPWTAPTASSPSPLWVNGLGDDTEEDNSSISGRYDYGARVLFNIPQGVVDLDSVQITGTFASDNNASFVLNNVYLNNTIIGYPASPDTRAWFDGTNAANRTVDITAGNAPLQYGVNELIAWIDNQGGTRTGFYFDGEGCADPMSVEWTYEKTGPDTCTVGEECVFTIPITNNNPAGSPPYTGDLTLDEQTTPSNLPIQLSSPADPNWVCDPAITDTECTGSDVFAPGAPVTLTAIIDIPDDFAGDELTNCVSIPNAPNEPPACVTVDIVQPPHLSITKTAPDECEAGSDCIFTVTIENTGGAYTGPLNFGENTVPSGLALQPATLPVTGNANWPMAPSAVCSPPNTPATCQVLPASGGVDTMPGGGSSVSYAVTIPIPADFEGDGITNCVTLFTGEGNGVAEDCTSVPVNPPEPLLGTVVMEKRVENYTSGILPQFDFTVNFGCTQPYFISNFNLSVPFAGPASVGNPGVGSDQGQVQVPIDSSGTSTTCVFEEQQLPDLDNLDPNQYCRPNEYLQWDDPVYVPTDNQVQVSPGQSVNTTVINKLRCLPKRTELTINKFFDTSNGNMPNLGGALFDFAINGCSATPPSITLTDTSSSATVDVNVGEACTVTETSQTLVDPLPANCSWLTNTDPNLPLVVSQNGVNRIDVYNQVVCVPPLSTEHFQCYFVKQETPFEPVRSPNVVLDDQFGKTENRVIEPRLLCAPVNKDGEGLENKRDHLVFYELKERIPVNRLVEVENQFGKQRLRVLDSFLLGVPSLKTVIEEKPPILEIDKEAVSSPCIVGQLCDFIVTISNSGAPFTGNLQVTDTTTPAGLNLQSVSPPPPPSSSCVLPGSTPITCSTGPVTITQSSPLSFTATLLVPDPMSQNWIENCVKLFDGAGNLIDESCAKVEVIDHKGEEKVDLGVSKELLNGPLHNGDTAQFEVTVTNYGDPIISPYQVIVPDIMPPGFAFVSNSPNPPWDCEPAGAQSITCLWTGTGTIPSGTMPSFVIEADISGSKGGRQCASVEIDGYTDINPGNNESCIIVPVGPPTGKVDLGVHKRPLGGPVSVNDTVTFAIGVENHGTAISALQASQIVVTDLLPPGFAYTGTFSSSNGLWSCVAGPGPGQVECTWTGGPIAPNASLGVIYIETEVQKPDGGRQCAEVNISSVTDVNLNNNKDCIPVEVKPTGTGGGGTPPDTFACVTGLRSASSNLNMRYEPSGNARILQKLGQGTPLIILRRQGEWSQVQVADGDARGRKGWVATRFLRGVEKPNQCARIVQQEVNEPTRQITPKQPVNGINLGDDLTNGIIGIILPNGSVAPTDEGGFACVIDLPRNDPTLNVRFEPSGRAKIIGKLPGGTSLLILGRKGDWSLVQVIIGNNRGPKGWVASKFLRGVEKPNQCTRIVQQEVNEPTLPTVTEGILPTIGGDFACVIDLPRNDPTLNVRFEPSGRAKIIGKLPGGTSLLILERKGDWSLVQVIIGNNRGPKGWVASKFLRSVEKPNQC